MTEGAARQDVCLVLTANPFLVLYQVSQSLTRAGRQADDNHKNNSNPFLQVSPAVISHAFCEGTHYKSSHGLIS